MKEINTIRKDFPIFQNQDSDLPTLIYFDNAATSQKPQSVLDAICHYNKTANGNPHRGAHRLATAASEVYENARRKVAEFINADSMEEIIFTRNATESVNLIARSYGETHLQQGDKIVITIAEHHANLVPWQRVAERTGALLEYIYIDENGYFREEDFTKIDSRTKIVAFGHVSNVLGMKVPVERLTTLAHKQGAIVVLDGAQSAPHIALDMQDLDCDFFVFSGHKMLASQGIGVLYGKKNLLAEMEPFNLGGDMIEYVREQDTTFNELPYRFEAGTPNVEGAVSLQAAIKYLQEIGFDKIHEHEKRLTAKALNGLKQFPYVRIIGTENPADKYGVITFTIDDVHPHDVATILDSYGIAIRSGHHCAQPLGAFVKAPASNRISFYLYNTEEEVDYFLSVLPEVRKMMGLKG